MAVAACLALASTPLQALVISELYYNPPTGKESLSFVEVTNDADSPEDISGWAFVDGIRFVFPPGTVLRGRQILAVCADEAAVRSSYGVDNAIGNFEGRLDKSGERLTLINHAGVVIQSLRYRDRGKWPVGADGTGHSLVLKNLHLDTSEPENWRLSSQLGGSPGFADDLDARRSLLPETTAERGIVFNELYRGSDSESAWVEIFNSRSAALDLSGWSLTDHPDRDDPYVFPAGSTISGGGFLVVKGISTSLVLSAPEVQLFLINPIGLVGAATAFDRRPPSEFAPERYAEAYFPDGGRPGWVTPTPTPGAPNQVPRVTDLVINEIFYHPPEDRDGEFLELYNRGSASLDVSGFRFTKGVNYTFPAGTMIPQDGYLVIAEDPRLVQERYALSTVPGRWEGRLSNRGENVELVDRAGNLVDEVRYFDGGRWPVWADGGGASLELVDPRQDNDFASAWGASEESEKSAWQHHSFTVGEYQATSASRVHLLLADRGVCRVDDLSIVTGRFEDVVIVDVGDEWKFFKGTEPFSAPATAWRELDFDDSSWSSGVSGFGFGDEDDATILDDMPGRYSSLALRKRFDVNEDLLALSGGFVLAIDYDDGFCAFLNGTEIARANCPDVPSYDGTATRTSEAGFEEDVFEIPAGIVHAGENVLAIVGFNRRIGDLDFSLIPRLTYRHQVGVSDNFVPNAGFELDTRPWLIEGTHQDSDRITHDAHSGDACLEIVATGKGDTACNKIETDTEPTLQENQSYEVSLWTRWVRGSSLLLVHGEFSQGPWPRGENNMSGNALARGIRVSVPWNLGTPGVENSRRAIMRSETGDDNLGPGITAVSHSPPTPLPGTPVTVRARVADADGVASVRVFYKKDSGEVSGFESVELFPDTDRGMGAYAGDIPPVADETVRVVFYLEATDAAGNRARFPSAAQLVYLAEGPVVESLQLLFTEKNWTELQTRHVHSNALVDGAFVVDNELTYYGVGVRYRGSPWGRGGRQSLRIRFPKDQRFKEALRDINVSHRDTTDGAASTLLGRMGTTEDPVPFLDYKYAHTRLNGQAFGMPGVFETINKAFIEKWFGSAAAADGAIFKAVGRYSFDDDCQRSGWDEVTMDYRSEDVENYRFYFVQGMNQTRDNWQPLIELMRLIDRNVTPDAEFDETFEDVIDVEAFLRVIGARSLMNDEDALFIKGHNGALFWEPTSARFHYLAYDMGGAWGSPTGRLFGIGFPGVNRMLHHPRSLRSYYRTIYEYTKGYWSEEVAAPFLDALEEEVGIGEEIKSFISLGSPRALAAVESFVTAELRILTNAGEDFESDGAAVQLEGEASVLMTSLVLVRNGAQFEPFVPAWRSATEWRTTLSLTEGSNRFEIRGFDRSAQLMGSAVITISRSPEREFTRGNVDAAGSVSVGDAITTLLYLFRGRPLSCPDAADFDDNGVVNLGDALATLEFLFQQGDPPASPFPSPGRDPTDDLLECRG